MCVPCIVATPGLGEILLYLIMIPLAMAGLLIFYAGKAMPYILQILFWLTVGAYRYVTGAGVFKPWRQSEADYWAEEFRRAGRRPKVARHVRATFRVVGPALVVLGLLYPMVGAYLVSLSAGAGVGIGLRRLAIWRDNREANRRALGEPIRVKVKAGPAVRAEVRKGEPIRVRAVVGRG